MVVGGAVIIDAVVAIRQCMRANAAWRRAVATAGPVIRMRASANRYRTIADRVITEAIRVVITVAVTIIVAVTIRVIGPAGITGADKNRGAISASERADTISRGSTVASETRIVVTGASKQAEASGGEQKIFFHSNRVTRLKVIYSKRKKQSCRFA